MSLHRAPDAMDSAAASSLVLLSAPDPALFVQGESVEHMSDETVASSSCYLPTGLKQSCFTRNFGFYILLNDMCREAARLGAVGFDGLPSEQWPTLEKFGLISTVGLGRSMTIENGIIQKQMHNELVKSTEEFIDTCRGPGSSRVWRVSRQQCTPSRIASFSRNSLNAR